jgi:hypothetical protein
VWGARTVPGGFDSHALPPILFDIIDIFLVLDHPGTRPEFQNVCHDIFLGFELNISIFQDGIPSSVIGHHLQFVN